MKRNGFILIAIVIITLLAGASVSFAATDHSGDGHGAADMSGHEIDTSNHDMDMSGNNMDMRNHNMDMPGSGTMEGSGHDGGQGGHGTQEVKNVNVKPWVSAFLVYVAGVLITAATLRKRNGNSHELVN